jgi:hypothetical protein
MIERKIACAKCTDYMVCWNMGSHLFDCRLQEAERPDKEAIAAAPELKDKRALVVYFETDEDRDEFAAMLEAYFGPRARTVKIP